MRSRACSGASSSYEDLQDESAGYDDPITLSGASGEFLAQELAKWTKSRSLPASRLSERFVENWELRVASVYDGPFGSFFNFIYDVLQFSSGRDKSCALLQGYAKFASAVLSQPGSESNLMYRGIEDSLSDGRKIFRLFKEHREVYKVRRGMSRFTEGVSESGLMSISAACGVLDMLGHSCSFFYYLGDNLLWAASVGIVRAKEVPRWQRTMWKGGRKNGYVVSLLGGVASIKRKKNLASIWRLVFAVAANLLMLRKALGKLGKEGKEFQGPDDARLFHSLEVVGMAASFRILLSKLGYTQASHSTLGLLAMLAAACGIWSNWRKVLRKHCGTKTFGATLLERRVSICDDVEF